ncbi:MAG: hypothetical protein V5A55_08370 [Halovenus sp.]
MTTVRLIDQEIDPYNYPAIERTLVEGVAAGTAPPTILRCTFAPDLFLELGPVEDASLIDTDAAESHDVAYGRRFHSGGGTGFFRGDNTPLLYLFFPDSGEAMTDLLDAAGRAISASLRAAGVDQAEYGGGADVEAVVDGERVKLGVSGAGYQDGVWGVVGNVINRSYGEDEFAIIDDVLRLPKEKFEDKDTDSVAGRMSEVQTVAPGTDIDVVLDEAVANITDIIDRTAEEGSFTDDERTAIDEYTAEARTDDWFHRYSTTRLLADYGEEDRVAEVAFKSEKLIKASVIVGPDDVVRDIQFTGDMYHRPAYEALSRLEESVQHEAIDDVDAIRTDMERVFDQSDVEFPWLSPEDFVRTVDRANRNLIPVPDFER